MVAVMVECVEQVFNTTKSTPLVGQVFCRVCVFQVLQSAGQPLQSPCIVLVHADTSWCVHACVAWGWQGMAHTHTIMYTSVACLPQCVEIPAMHGIQFCLQTQHLCRQRGHRRT